MEEKSKRGSIGSHWLAGTFYFGHYNSLPKRDPLNAVIILLTGSSIIIVIMSFLVIFPKQEKLTKPKPLPPLASTLFFFLGLLW